MNNFSVLDSRNRRNLLAHSMNAFSPPFHANYSTTSVTEMKTSFGDSLFINTLHLIPEPMKMNLADSVVTLDEKKQKTNMAAETKVNNGFNTKKPQNTKSDYYPSLAGITNFFSGVFNVMGAMFQKRANSPVQYYDCFEQGFEEHHQMTPSSRAWRCAKHEDQNINGRAQTDDFANETYTDFSSDMSKDFKSIAAHCEDKINRVRLLLNNPVVNKSVRTRRPKRAFHEAGSVEELFEDAFTPEDFISFANETFLDYCSPYNNHHEELQTVESPKVKTETKAVQESMEIIQNLPSECGESKSDTPKEKVDTVDTKREVVSSCEDKLSQLKALLQSSKTQKSKLNNSKLSVTIDSNNPPESKPIPIVNQPDTQSCTDAVFAKEIELPITPESPCVLAPNSYFDEVTGRFYSSSATDSEDSFQIVFSDSPRDRRKRIPSDCESEDSFIVFEESPDSCYTTNDVFGDDINDATNVSDSENSDSDCESDLDSGVSTMALSHTLTRTFGDLTDGSLYEDSKSEDVVDCAFRSGVEIPKELIDAEKVSSAEALDHQGDGKKGLLLDESRKRERKKLPEKKVRFSEQPPKVHVMRVWAFAARQARAGPWERHALDRERFKRRIADVEMAISWVLKPQHRSRVMFQRFMPWWNAQKRKELAEKKQREEEERLKREEAERLATEEARIKGNNFTDSNEVDNKQIVSNLEDNDKIVSEKTAEHIGNGANDFNCKADITDAKNIVNSARVDIKPAFNGSLDSKTQDVVYAKIILEDEHKNERKAMSNGDVTVNCRLDNVNEARLSGLEDKTCGALKVKIETDTDNEIDKSETRIETVFNENVNLNLRLDLNNVVIVNDEMKIKDGVSGSYQGVKENIGNSQNVKTDFVIDDLKVNGDLTMSNHTILKKGIDKSGFIVCLQHGQRS